MPHPPDPALADSIVNWAMFGIGIAGALWRRRKQNEKTVAAIKAASAEEVAALRKIVEDLQASKEADQTRSAIMTEKINHLDGTMSATNTRLDRLELALPKVEDVLQKTLNFFERAKGGALVEKPIAGSGGLTAIKKKEEK
jgi:predicted ATP-grasp superfamily ATP-dependent carboligase